MGPRTACSSCRSAVERPWFAQRLKDVLAEAFGKEPVPAEAPPGRQLLRRSAPATRSRTLLAAESRTSRPTSIRRADEARSGRADRRRLSWPASSIRSIAASPVIIWVMSLGLIVVCSLAFFRLKGSRGGRTGPVFLGGVHAARSAGDLEDLGAALRDHLAGEFVRHHRLVDVHPVVEPCRGVVPELPADAGLCGPLPVADDQLPRAGEHDLFRFDGGAAAAMALYCSPSCFPPPVFIPLPRHRICTAEAFGPTCSARSWSAAGFPVVLIWPERARAGGCGAAPAVTGCVALPCRRERPVTSVADINVDGRSAASNSAADQRSISEYPPRVERSLIDSSLGIPNVVSGVRVPLTASAFSCPHASRIPVAARNARSPPGSACRRAARPPQRNGECIELA